MSESSDIPEYIPGPYMYLYSLLMFSPIAFAFFYRNMLHILALFWLGIVFVVTAGVIILLAGYEFKTRGGAKEGDSVVKTTQLVDTGIYGLIRHPQYLSMILVSIGFAFISQHYLALLSSLAGVILFNRDIVQEEELSTIKFGSAYVEYMEKVPRINILLGIYRKLVK